jgi:uncharacterized protein (DUF302 family)
MFNFLQKYKKSNFAYAVTSEMEIENIIHGVPSKIESSGFALLQTYNYHEIVASKGFPIDRKVFVYEICKAKLAAAILESNPNFAPMMPCRIAIFENQSGTCTISTPDMKPIISILPAKNGLREEANELFEIVKRLVEDLALKN